MSFSVYQHTGLGFDPFGWVAILEEEDFDNQENLRHELEAYPGLYDHLEVLGRDFRWHALRDYGGTVHSFALYSDGELALTVSGFGSIDAATFYQNITQNRATTYAYLNSLLDDDTTVTGNDAAQEIELGAGNDTVDAAGGNDRIVKFRPGNLTLDGGAGIDTLQFIASMGVADPTAPVQSLIVNLATGAGQNPYGGTLSLTPNSVENVIGTPQADTITGSDAANVIGDPVDTGADVIDARGGDDLIKLGWAATGGATVDGGAGFDTLEFLVSDFTTASATVVLDLQNPANNTFVFAGGSYTNIEKFQAMGGGLAGQDDIFVFRGSDAGETVIGIPGTGNGTPSQQALVGRDQLFGGGGDDFLDGRSGSDLIDGGAGTDTAVFSSAAPADHLIRTYLAGGVLTTTVITQAGLAQTDTLVSIERIKYDALNAPTNGTFVLAGAQLNNRSNVAGSRFDDVLIQNGADGQVYFARMSDGAFQEWGVVTGAMGSDWKAVAAGDVNPSAAQGAAETFIQQQSTGSVYYASRDTGATTWGVVSTQLTPAWKLRAAADVNRDASVDAVVQNEADGTIYFADMKGGVFQGWGVVNANLTADWVAAGAGDVNGDGFADVIVQQQSSGTTLFANMAGGVFSGWGVVSSNLTPDWQVKAVADVTRDGLAEVIFQNANAGGVTYYADLESGVVEWGVVAANVTADWRVQGVADIDNDGAADVLFQHAATGSILAAEVNGAGPGTPAWSAVATSLTADWQVV